MTTRERGMAVILGFLVLAVGGGFAGYQFALKPMRSKDASIESIRREITKNEDRLFQTQQDLKRMDVLKRISLPANVDVASREYGAELARLLRSSEFPSSDTSIIHKPAENVANLPPAKRPPFTRISFEIQTHGDVGSLVTFLDSFYRLPLLHRIKTMNVLKPATPKRPNELDITLIIEALVLEGAENRTTLLPEGVVPPPKLARPSAQYVSIAGRDVFYGPAPVQKFEMPHKDVDLSDYVVFDGIVLDEKASVATLWDAFNNLKYEIRGTNSGRFSVRTSWYLKGTSKPKFKDLTDDLVIKDENDDVIEQFEIVRIDATELILRDKGDDKYLALHVGQRVSEVKELSDKEAKERNLPVKEKTKTEKKDTPPKKDTPTRKDAPKKGTDTKKDTEPKNDEAPKKDTKDTDDE